jgi:hypothetical protein
MGGRLGSRDGGGSSTGGSSWDGGSLTGGRLRSGSLIGVFLRLLMGVPRGPIAQDFNRCCIDCTRRRDMFSRKGLPSPSWSAKWFLPFHDHKL